MEIDNKVYEKLAVDLYTMGAVYDRNKLIAIIKHLGPSVHDADASLVACSDKNGTHYIKEKFLIGKLGLNANDPRLDKAIDNVCDLMGKSNRHKSRTTLYYMLMAILNIEYTVLEN